MAKEQKEIKDNIADLPLLRKEFERGQMQARKLTALRMKLIELYTAKISTEKENELMTMILKRDHLKGSISDANLEILNRIEVKKADEEAYVKIDNAPSVHFLSKDQKVKFYKDNDKDRFVVFVERRIPPSHQMTEDLLFKEMRGHFAPESEYPKERTLLHRLDLTVKEFNAWFQVIDSDDLKAEKEETFTF